MRQTYFLGNVSPRETSFLRNMFEDDLFSWREGFNIFTMTQETALELVYTALIPIENTRLKQTHGKEVEQVSFPCNCVNCV